MVNGTELSFNLEDDSVLSAYPYPSFTWTHNGNSVVNSSAAMFGYPSVTFSPVEASLSGTFTLSASNYYDDDPTRLLGTGYGSFTLDVLCEYK